MSKDPHQSDLNQKQPADEDLRKGLDAKAREAEAHLRRAEAALREQPDDLEDSARQTTPAGKGRSQ